MTLKTDKTTEDIRLEHYLADLRELWLELAQHDDQPWLKGPMLLLSHTIRGMERIQNERRYHT